MNKHRANRSIEEMRPHIKEWERSSQTKKSFCKTRGLALSVFYYWQKKYREEIQPGGFVPIDMAVPPVGSGVVEIKYPNGVTLCLPADTPSSAIRQYVYL
jgi:hypothetical protein